MVLDRRVFRAVGLVAGVVFLVGLLALPVWGQEQTTVENQQFGDLTAGQCIAIINNNGNQYSPMIIQNCNQLLDDQDEETNNGDTTDNADTEDSGNDEAADAEEGVVKDSVPDKDLPETGGVPLLGILFAVTVGAGLLTAVVRRRH